MTPNSFEVSVEAEVEQIEMDRPHVVLLGAGASRAAFPNGEANGKRLPLMADFADIVPVKDILKNTGVNYVGRNFEDIYSELYARVECFGLRAELEEIIFHYFSSLRLPSEPTLYDHLVLSLRPKDVIATFNWDPFLIQAVMRNRLVAKNPPKILFLHGNVAAGYCRRDSVHGVRGRQCSYCGDPLEASRLLFPVATKSYDENPQISDAWWWAKQSFKAAFMITIFGYGAPTSDAAAVRLLEESWGGAEKRSMEQFEIIDLRPEDELVGAWQSFIHSHHYEIHTTIYESWLLKHPRRSGEAYLNQYLHGKFIDDNPVPRHATFSELEMWFSPLFRREQDTPLDASGNINH